MKEATEQGNPGLSHEQVHHPLCDMHCDSVRIYSTNNIMYGCRITCTCNPSAIALWRLAQRPAQWSTCALYGYSVATAWVGITMVSHYEYWRRTSLRWCRRQVLSWPESSSGYSFNLCSVHLSIQAVSSESKWFLKYIKLASPLMPICYYCKSGTVYLQLWIRFPQRSLDQNPSIYISNESSWVEVYRSDGKVW